MAYKSKAVIEAECIPNSDILAVEQIPLRYGTSGEVFVSIPAMTLYKIIEIQSTYEEIACICNISVDTLRERLVDTPAFARLIALGRNAGKTSLRREQYNAAIVEHNTRMLELLGMNWLGQSRREDQRILSQDVSSTVAMDLTVLSDEQLLQLADIQATLSAPPSASLPQCTTQPASTAQPTIIDAEVVASEVAIAEVEHEEDLLEQSAYYNTIVKLPPTTINI